jgi:peptidoglycan/xylan/chitin deacetylase (PgdA/CDA1 family)
MKIFITLDYELVLGSQTGSVQSCLVKSSEALCQMLQKYGVPVTFFVDCAYLLRMRELKDDYPTLQKDYEDVVSNLQYLQKQGHSLQYHFHPQWLYSTYGDDGWHMDYDHYKLSDVEETKLRKDFHEGIKLLESITQEKPVAFRAGGFSLTTCDYYIDLFKDNDIHIDSSVNGGKVNSKLHSYDYSKAPKRTFWRFNKDVNIPDDNGLFKEYSITRVGRNRLGLFNMLDRYKLKAMYDSTIEYCDGGGAEFSKFDTFKKYFPQLFQFGQQFMTMDIFYSCALVQQYETVSKTNEDHIVVIGHPKHLSDAAINNTEQFIIRALKDNAEFCVMNN